jgi:hypothetical protein
MGKQLALLKEACPTSPAWPSSWTRSLPRQPPSRVKWSVRREPDVRGADEAQHALAEPTREPAKALTIPPFPILLAQRQRILSFAAQSRLPVMATDQREWIGEGPSCSMRRA